jgi:hypothetical protein
MCSSAPLGVVGRRKPLTAARVLEDGGVLGIFFSRYVFVSLIFFINFDHSKNKIYNYYVF